MSINHADQTYGSKSWRHFVAQTILVDPTTSARHAPIPSRPSRYCGECPHAEQSKHLRSRRRIPRPLGRTEHLLVQRHLVYANRISSGPQLIHPIQHVGSDRNRLGKLQLLSSFDSLVRPTRIPSRSAPEHRTHCKCRQKELPSCSTLDPREDDIISLTLY